MGKSPKRSLKVIKDSS